MRRRCYEPRDKSYKNYGARGIKICTEWLNDFDVFARWAVDNGYAHNLSIDRIDNAGSYEPSNCRWATPKQQARNTRTNRPLLDGCYKISSVSEAAELHELSAYTLFSRLRAGWEERRALTVPTNSHIRFLEFRGFRGSLKQMANRYGISDTILRKRLAAGKTVEEALLVKSLRAKMDLEFRGFRGSQQQMARRYSMSPATLSYRLRAGWTLENALLTPAKNKKAV